MSASRDGPFMAHSPFAKAAYDLLSQDMHGHHGDHFGTMLSTQVPLVVAQYGQMSSDVGNTRFDLTQTEVKIMNSRPTEKDCFEFGCALTCNITVKATLSATPLGPLTDEQKTQKVERTVVGEPVVVHHARLPIAKLPLMTGVKHLMAASFSEMDEPSQLPAGVFISNGKARTCPPVKSLLYNTPFFMKRKDAFVCQIRSAHHDKVFRATSTIEFHLQITVRRAIREGLVLCRLPFVSSANLPTSVLACALGCPSGEAFNELVKQVAHENYRKEIFRVYDVQQLYPAGPCARVQKVLDGIVAERNRNNDPPSEAEIKQMTACLTIAKVLGNPVLSTGKNVLHKEVFPHLLFSPDEDEKDWMPRKLLYLAKITVDLIMYKAGKFEPPHRDSYTNTRIITSADAVGQLFRLMFIPHITIVKKLFRRALLAFDRKQTKVRNDTGSAQDDYSSVMDLQKLFGEQRLSARLLSAVSNGSWSNTRKGVTISLNTNNSDAIFVQLRRVSSSLTCTDGAHTSPRDVSPDQYGYICPANTPGGESTGLVYELSMLATITPIMNNDVDLLNDFCVNGLLQDLIVTDLSVLLNAPDINVLFFYDALGRTRGVFDKDNLDAIVHRVWNARRDGTLPVYTFLRYDEPVRTLRLMCEGGLLTRPLIVYDVLEKVMTTTSKQDINKMSLETMIRMGLIEYTTPSEESTLCVVAVTLNDIAHAQKQGLRVTHVEVLQPSLLGVISACVPYVTSQQGPRLSYYCSQVKQFLTCEANNPRRGAVKSTRLWYAHRALVLSRTALTLGMGDGRFVPLTVAFAPHKWCQEDAIVIKKSTIERGALCGSTSVTYLSDCSLPNTFVAERFEKLDVVLSRKYASYSNITKQGLPPIGSKIGSSDTDTRVLSASGMHIPDVANRELIGNVSEEQDVVISKVRAIKSRKRKATTSMIRGDGSRDILMRDVSTVLKPGFGGTVVESKLTKLPSGTRATVTVETTRFPRVGDKLSTRYSQKGVIGAIVPEQDMMFSMETGVSPDVIVSPLSITSRKTMNSLIEALTGKAVCVSGDYDLGVCEGDFQSSHKHIIEKMGKVLEANGFTASGKETFIDGITGEMLDAKVFVGVISYARLVHLADVKLYARSTGNVDPMSRQPTEGRRVNGGLRFGEMEVASAASHGASKILQERIVDFADVYDIYMCTQCDEIAEACVDIDYYFCEHCETRENVARVRIPFTLRLLQAELEAIGVKMRFVTKKNEDGSLLVTSLKDEDDKQLTVTSK